MSLFRRGPDRRDVQAQIESVRGLVEILSLSRANLSAAKSLINQAEGLLARDDTIRARDICARAERIATALEADYHAATDAVERVKSLMEQMKALGISTAGETKALDAVHERAISTRALEGTTVPDYAGARALAEAALARAEGALGLADRTTDGIFAAEMAIESAAEAFGGGTVDVLREPRELVEKARAELASGDVEGAARDAAAAEKLAIAATEDRRRALETATSVERLAAGLRSLGVSVGPIMRSLEVGKSLLAKGKIASAAEVLNEASQDAVRLGQEYRSLLDAVSAAAKVLHELRGSGLPTGEAESAFARAKAAMKSGNYALAATCAEEVHRAAQRQRESRERLRAQLEEAKVQVQNLRQLGIAFANDVEEMVGKAERAFEVGDYAATSEDLRIASLLVKPALKGQDREPTAVPR